MAILRGIETTALGRLRTVEVSYEGGAYVDAKGKAVGLEDRTCYSCMNSYFVLSDDPIDYCPHCGRREGKTWAEPGDAIKWAGGQDFSYLKRLGLEPFAALKSDGVWVLCFARDTAAVLGTGRFLQAKGLRPGAA